MRLAGATMALATLVLGVAGAAHAGATPASAYQRIKERESALGPAPAENAVVTVGTLDCESGVFTMGPFPKTTREIAGGGFKTTQHVTHYAVGAFAKHVTMRFDVAHRAGRAVAASLSFGASAQTGTGALVNPRQAAAGQEFVAFDIGEASGRFTFAVQCGEKVANGPRLPNDGRPSTGFADPVHCPKENAFCACPPADPGCTRRQHLQEFEHVHLWAGAGAFEVEAVPVAIVYEPPEDRAKRSSATVLDNGAVGAAAAIVVPANRSETPNGGRVATREDLARRLLATGNAYAVGVAGVLDAIATGALAAPRDTARLPATAASQVGPGGDPRGPGDDDQIWVYERAYFAWTTEAERVGTVFLGADGFRAHSVWQLKADLAALVGNEASRPGKRTSLHRPTIQSLLALDPFASGAAAPADRFVDATAQLAPGRAAVCPTSPAVYRLAIDPSYAHADTTARVVAAASGFGNGWLAALGREATLEAPRTVDIGLSRPARVSSASAIYEARVAPPSANAPCYEVQFDRLFGTFAWKAKRPP